MRVCCLSDLHGNLIDVPECDLLILAGDLCRNHRDYFWYNTVLKPWIDETAKRCKIVGVAGNHDFIFQFATHLIPQMEWVYLQDSGIEWNGLKIWGSPWQLRFFDWAFNLDEEDLKKRWDMIPDDTNILVLHGPPYGYGDKTPERPSGYGEEVIKSEHVGSPSLTDRIESLKCLKLAVAGHIHNGYGIYKIKDTTFVNASLVNERYMPVNNPIVIDI